MTCKGYVKSLTRELAENCQFIADTLRGASVRVVTDEELAAYWPGGEENKESDELRSWITAYAALVRFCDRIPEEREATSDEERSLLDDALLDTPEVIALSGDREISVYPKSYNAIRVVESCDRRISWLNARRSELSGAATAIELDTIERLEDEVFTLYGKMAWAVTHSEAGLPFDDDAIAIELPKEIRALSTIDFSLIRAAYIRVNLLRLAFLLKMLSEATGTEPSSRDSWGGFFATQEIEGHGPAKHLMRDRSLVSQVAAALKVAQARKRAEQDAERKSNAA